MEHPLQDGKFDEGFGGLALTRIPECIDLYKPGTPQTRTMHIWAAIEGSEITFRFVLGNEMVWGNGFEAGLTRIFDGCNAVMEKLPGTETWEVRVPSPALASPRSLIVGKKKQILHLIGVAEDAKGVV